MGQSLRPVRFCFLDDTRRRDGLFVGQTRVGAGAVRIRDDIRRDGLEIRVARLGRKLRPVRFLDDIWRGGRLLALQLRHHACQIEAQGGRRRDRVQASCQDSLLPQVEVGRQLLERFRLLGREDFPIDENLHELEGSGGVFLLRLACLVDGGLGHEAQVKCQSLEEHLSVRGTDGHGIDPFGSSKAEPTNEVIGQIRVHHGSFGTCLIVTRRSGSLVGGSGH